MTRAVSAGFLDAFRQIQMGAAGGADAGASGGGAAGLIDTSFETGDAGGGFGGSSAGRSSAAGLGGGGYRGVNGADLSGGAATGERADFIRSVAAKLGIDPRVAVAVSRSEGLGGLTGDHGTSWGDFQLHRGGLADIYEKQTGNSASDPSKWKEADEWALKYAAKNGWGSWHGAARIGVTGMMGVGAGGTAVGPGSIGKGDAVGMAENMAQLGANSAQAQAMLKHRMTPGEWCADFVNGVIQGAGGHGVNSSMARAFDTWGRAVGANDAKRGDVILERHGNHTGHVGLRHRRPQTGCPGQRHRGADGVRQLRWPGPDELGTGRHHRGYEAGRSGFGAAAQASGTSDRARRRRHPGQPLRS